MRSRTKMRVLRGMGGVVAALAVVPWLGAGAAQASSQDDGSCSTMPSGVGAGSTCTLLTGPNGTTVFGETWVVRTTSNQLKVKTFPFTAPESADAVSLCVATTAYPAKHQCNAGDPDNVFTGSATSITVTLADFSIKAGDPVFYSLSVIQASTSAVSNGSGGSVPTQSPTPTETTASPSPTKTHTQTATPSPTKSHTQTATPTTTESTGSPSASPTKSHTKKPTPSASVLPTKIHRTDATASPSTSVLAVKLARTGADGTANALALSVGLLAIGGVLVAAGQNSRPKRRH